MVGFGTLTETKTVDGSIRNWVNNDTVPSTVVLSDGEKWIYQRLRVRQMLATFTGTMTTSESIVALPTNYRGPKLLMFIGNGTVGKSLPEKHTIDNVMARFEWDGDGNRTTGLPRVWAADGANLQFEKEADQARPFSFLHYAAGTALGASNDTNFLTEEYPRLLRSVVTAFSYEFLKNQKEKLYWLAIAAKEIEDANIESDLELSTADLQMFVE